MSKDDDQREKFMKSEDFSIKKLHTINFWIL